MKAYCDTCQKKQKMKKLTYVDGDVGVMRKCTSCGRIYVYFTGRETEAIATNYLALKKEAEYDYYERLGF